MNSADSNSRIWIKYVNLLLCCVHVCIYAYNWFDLTYLSKYIKGTAVAQWLKCCATNRKVAGSMPSGVSGFFIDINSFWSYTMALGLTQPLTEMSTRSISWGA